MSIPEMVQADVDRIIREATWTVEDWTDFYHALEDIKRKIAMRHWKPHPIARCGNCGEEAFYTGSGHWKQHHHERQVKEFWAKHAHCLSIADGGCI